MPLYIIKHGDKTRLVSAKSPQGAKNHVLRDVASALQVKSATAMDAAELAFSGIAIEHAGRETVTQDFSGDTVTTTVESGGKEVPVTVYPDTGYVDDSGVMDPRVEATQTAAVPVGHDLYNESLGEATEKGEDNAEQG